MIVRYCVKRKYLIIIKSKGRFEFLACNDLSLIKYNNDVVNGFCVYKH